MDEVKEEAVIVDAPIEVSAEVAGAPEAIDAQVVPDAVTSPDLVPEEVIGKVEDIAAVPAVANHGGFDTDKGLVLNA